jgi:hypothetical protein
MIKKQKKKKDFLPRIKTDVKKTKQKLKWLIKVLKKTKYATH